MNRGKIISLNCLAETHRKAVDRMAEGIRGDAESVLWTAELRTSTRGGKPWGGPRLDEEDGSDS